MSVYPVSTSPIRKAKGGVGKIGWKELGQKLKGIPPYIYRKYSNLAWNKEYHEKKYYMQRNRINGA